MENQSLEELLPPPDLPEFTRFQLDTSSTQAWLDQLPSTNLGDTTRALYEALTELNRCTIPPRQRLAVVDTLRGLLENIRNQLARHYLGQPIILPPQAARVANLAETLNRVLAENYARVAADAGNDKQLALLAAGAARACEAINANLLLACQLYRPPVAGSWRLLHRLYRLLHEAGLADRPLQTGELLMHPTIPYRSALLLGSARPSQLRQRDLEALHLRLPSWAEHIVVEPQFDQRALWCIDPHSDSGPVLAELVGSHDGWSFDTRPVADHLDAADGLHDALLTHLQAVWQAPSKRSFLRLDGGGYLDVTLGLLATHHFVANEEEFQMLADGSQTSPWEATDDPSLLHPAPPSHPYHGDRGGAWKEADPGQGSQLSMEDIDYPLRPLPSHRRTGSEPYQIHRVDSLNSSPGGYCLQWAPDARVSLRAGELIGLRPGDRDHWSIAAVRWVQLRREGPSIGVELLSPTALPYVARPAGSSGSQGDFHRVLVLPEVPAIGQPTTLITPHLPFREGQRVELMQYGRKTSIKLTRQLTSTGVFSQFRFRRLTGPDQAPPADSASGFDALWDQL